MKHLILTVALAAATGTALGNPAEPAAPVLVHEDFSALAVGQELPEGWWAEGSEAVAVRDGALVQNANPEAGAQNANSVVWIGDEVEGDIRFEADVTAVSAKGNVNDVVVFFLFSDPSGKPLRDTRQQRASGKQDLYTKALNGYVLFYWGKGGVTTPANIRLRDCPGGHLLLETNKHAVETGTTYRLAIEKQGPVLRLFVDGEKLAEHRVDTDEVANPVHAKGLIGLKTWNTELRWDNIRITRQK
jgi:hypothetical protein